MQMVFIKRTKKGWIKMKDREVVETLNDMKGVFGERGHSQYSLTAIDRAINAIEKQIPVNPISKAGRYSGHYLCPNCNRTYWKDEPVPNYCKSCGQKFDLE